MADHRRQAGQAGRQAGQVGQGRAGQGRAGQGRAEQGRAGQGRAGQGRAGRARGLRARAASFTRRLYPPSPSCRDARPGASVGASSAHANGQRRSRQFRV